MKKKSGPFQPEKFQDHYASELKKLLQDKLKGRKVVAPHEEARPKGANVVDLMEALRKSVGSGGTPPARSKSKTGAGDDTHDEEEGLVNLKPVIVHRDQA